jgi:membrane protein YdbS with pleckstrin-like domain
MIEDVADGANHALDPRYLILQRQLGWISAGASAAIFAIPCVFALFASFTGTRALLLLVLWAGVTATNAWWKQKRPALEYARSGYRIDANGIEIRQGIWWRNTVSVPRSRVQHTDVSQGPFERKHGLGTLSIHTAGVNHSVVSLSGLDYQRALRIRDYLLPRGETDVV